MSEAARGNTKAIVAGLKKSPLLSQLPDRHLKRLASYAKVRDIPAGTTVVKRGEKGLGFYVILDGRVQVKKGSTNLAKLGPGDFFGELALYNDRPRSADVVTIEPSTVVVLSRWEFWGFATDRPEVLKVILVEMARRLEQTGKVAAA
ncbi:MAG TPA: cyclic nucleotide-binding domain-containing protein [Thermoplasmata archaeon]|nr:cyclic nucleotide-binding domain-containing protein [Thermoplasmata archaeon]